MRKSRGRTLWGALEKNEPTVYTNFLLWQMGRRGLKERSSYQDTQNSTRRVRMAHERSRSYVRGQVISDLSKPHFNYNEKTYFKGFYAVEWGCHICVFKRSLWLQCGYCTSIEWKWDHCSGSGRDDSGLDQWARDDSNTNQDGERGTGSKGVLVISDTE